jgi:ligand-binding SRPBCC domain-containing protein
MYTFEHSVFINRPVQEVWEYVSEPSNHPKFEPPESREWTSGAPHGVGSTYHAVSRFLE